MSHKWEWSQWTHNLLGGISGTFTIFAFGIVYRSKEFHLAWRKMYHTRYGAFAMGLGLILITMGILAWYKRRGVKPWSTRAMLNFKRAHMYFGYFMIVWVQTAVCSGLIWKVINSNQSIGASSAPWMIVVNLLIPIIVLGFMEYNHRKFSSKDYEIRAPKVIKNYSAFEFK